MRNTNTVMTTDNYDTCELCGRPIYSDGDTTCRHCRKRSEARRRTLRLAKERRQMRGIYGRV